MSEHEHPKESSGEDAMATGPGAPRGDGLGFHFSLEGNELVGAKIGRDLEEPATRNAGQEERCK